MYQVSHAPLFTCISRTAFPTSEPHTQLADMILSYLVSQILEHGVVGCPSVLSLTSSYVTRELSFGLAKSITSERSREYTNLSQEHTKVFDIWKRSYAARSVMQSTDLHALHKASYVVRDVVYVDDRPCLRIESCLIVRTGTSLRGDVAGSLPILTLTCRSPSGETKDRSMNPILQIPRLRLANSKTLPYRFAMYAGV